MKKKVLSLILVAAMGLSMLVGCGGGSNSGTQGGDKVDNSKKITIWVAENIVEFTKTQASEWQKANADYADFEIVVEAVGEGDAAGNMITDVTGGADVYGFAQDQTARLVAAGALTPLTADEVAAVKAANDAASLTAATVGDNVVAFPITSDNGYFLFYDKSVVTDPSTIEGIIEQCAAAGKQFYFEMNSGWYQTALFFGAGCELTYETDKTGAFTACNVSYANDNGVKALKTMIDLHKNAAFVNGSDCAAATNYGAIVSGTWNTGVTKEALGENYACAKLPTFQGMQMGGFSGNKLLGVKPQTDATKLAACKSLAAYLTSGEVQLARYNEVGWGPSNLEAQANEAVKADEALTALGEQMAYMVPQGQYPGDYWTLATALGDSVIAGEYDSYSDEELLAVLEQFEADCKSYAGQ